MSQRHMTSTNQESFAITSNLAELLQRMRYQLHIRTFWIDAICINQNNNEEKSNQIPMMMSIYRCAFQVNLWLGYHPEEEAMMSFLNRFSRRRTPTNEFFNVDTEAAREALYGILRLPWFTRRWIVQEAVVNPDVTVFCGTETMSLIRLFNLVHWLGSKTDPLLKPVRAMKELWDKLAYGSTRPAEDEEDEEDEELSPSTEAWENPQIHGSLCPMAELMERFDNFDCADPRDRIYALSGLQSCVNITPDYDRTTEDVYIDFAITMCSHGQVQWVLNKASDRHNGSSLPGLPSWVPDWRLRPLRWSMIANTPLRSRYIVSNSERLKSGGHAITLKAIGAFPSSYNRFTSASICWKGDPFPSDPKKEQIQGWIEHVEKFLSETHPQFWDLHHLTSRRPLPKTFSGLLSVSEVATALLKPYCKFLQDPLLPKIYGAFSQSLYESFPGAD